MIVIAAKIEVTDELGGIYRPTYPKRAKNLVKQGRARLISARRICLLRPPEQCMEEDKFMETKTFSRQEVLNRIDAILGDHSYLKEAFDAIEKIQASGQDADSVKTRVFAVESIAREREETNRRVLGLLETMLGNPEPAAVQP